MSRCYICDYSSSADSAFNSGLQMKHTVEANRVIYSKELANFICLQCNQDHFDQKNYWADIDGVTEDFNAYEQQYTEEDVSQYTGCTEKPTD